MKAIVCYAKDKPLLIGEIQKQGTSTRSQSFSLPLSDRLPVV